MSITVYDQVTTAVQNDARRWSMEEATRQINNMTFLRNLPGQRNEVFYFSPENIVYVWMSTTKFVQSTTWSVQRRTVANAETPSIFVCMTFPQVDANGDAIPGPTLTRCLEPGILFLASVDRAQGDVFGLRGRKQPPFKLPIDRTTISALAGR
ncbi:MAG: hypothetical protein U1E23_18920 [Reyranellaceae bacterium]